MHHDSTPQAAARPARGTIVPRPLRNGFALTTAAARCLGGAATKLLNALRVLAFDQDGAEWSPERMAAEAGISRSAFYYCVDQLEKTPVPDYAKDPTGNTPFADGRTFLVILGKGPKRRLYPIDGRCQVTAPSVFQPADCPKFGQIPSKVWTPGAASHIGPHARILDPVLDQKTNVNVGFFVGSEPEKPKDACVVRFADSGMGEASDYTPADGSGNEPKAAELDDDPVLVAYLCENTAFVSQADSELRAIIDSPGPAYLKIAARRVWAARHPKVATRSGEEPKAASQGALEPVAVGDPECTELEDNPAPLEDLAATLGDDADLVKLTADELRAIIDAPGRQGRKAWAKILLRNLRVGDQAIDARIPADPAVSKPPPPPARRAAPAPDTPVTLDALVKRLKPGAAPEHVLAFAEHMVSAWDDGGSRGLYLWAAGHVVDGKITSSELLRTCKSATGRKIDDCRRWFSWKIHQVIADAELRARKAAAAARR